MNKRAVVNEVTGAAIAIQRTGPRSGDPVCSMGFRYDLKVQHRKYRSNWAVFLSGNTRYHLPFSGQDSRRPQDQLQTSEEDTPAIGLNQELEYPMSPNFV